MFSIRFVPREGTCEQFSRIFYLHTENVVPSNHSVHHNCITNMKQKIVETADIGFGYR